MKSKMVNLDSKINEDETNLFKGTVKTPVRILGTQTRIGARAKVDVKRAVRDSSGLLGQGVKDLDPTTRQEIIDDARCRSETNKGCEFEN